MYKPKTRLWIDAPFHPGAHLQLSSMQANYVLSTLRMREGDALAAFNGKDGEWEAHLVHVGKKQAQLQLVRQTAPHHPSPDIHLAFAPVKNEKIDYTVKRATELGVSALLPVMTRHTIVSRVNMERLEANIIEAAEQSGRHDVPVLHAVQDLPRLLAEFKNRTLLFCDEAGGEPLKKLLPSLKPGPYTVLIGPEGGFANEERALIYQQPYAIGMSLGPRVLRAETAALSALANLMAWVEN